MAMGSFNRRDKYRQENAMGNANAMSYLQKMRGDSFNKVGDAVENYGQSRARGKIADLMGSGDLEGMTPEQTQAAIQVVTGGRNVGDAGRNTIKELLSSNRNTQSNTWKENAATKLFDRQNSQIAQRNANAVSLAGLNNKARQQLYGDTTTNVNGETPESILAMQEEVAKIQSEIDNPDTADFMRKQLKDEILKKKIQTELLIKKGKHNAGASQSLMEAVFPGQKVGKPAKITKAAVPTSLKVGLNSSQTDGLQRGINSGQLVVMPYESKPDANGKTHRRYKVTDSMGNEVSKNKYSRF